MTESVAASDSSESGETRPDSIASFDQIDALLAAHATVGVGVALIEDGAITLVRNWGVRDAETGEPLGEQTLFQAGSISKPVAALGALRLADEGALDLDADIVEYGLNLASLQTEDGWRPHLTARMLLAHLSGLSVWGFPGYAVDDEMPTGLDVIGGRGNTPTVLPEGVPDLTWLYSGGGYTVLQELMVKVGGGPFPELLKRLVLEPVGMTRSTYEQPLPRGRQADATSGHIGMEVIEGRWHVYPEMAAAGLWTTPSDLARFCLAVADAYTGRRDALLSPAIARMMLSGQARAGQMGLGFFLSTRGTLVFGHAGANHGYISQMACAADGSTGAVAMTNSIEGMPVARAIVQHAGALRGVELPPDVEWLHQASAASDRFDDIPTGRGSSPASGTYALGQLPVEVELEGDVVRITIGEQPPLDFVEHDGHWRARSLHTAARFVGECLILYQYGRELVAPRGLRSDN